MDEGSWVLMWDLQRFGFPFSPGSETSCSQNTPSLGRGTDRRANSRLLVLIETMTCFFFFILFFFFSLVVVAKLFLL